MASVNKGRRRNIKVTETDKIIGMNIKIMRVSKGFNCSKLAYKIGITPQQMGKYEKGTNRISASAIWNFAKIMNCPIDCFFQNIINLKEKENVGNR
jgi:transcriptional regulator with XRE-family HTH domain